MARLLTGVSDSPPPPSSESLSEADYLEGNLVQTYCLWSPNSPQGSFMLMTSVKKRKSFIGREKKVHVSSALEALYVQNRESKSMDKINSFLPYRKNLFGPQGILQYGGFQA
ncbi:unnamed protein product [Lupinus luteus]|uniref:Uncharacterized protein n=1 Tax=Lupinus luteus TaxID=3873 RepID=A0AAV1X9U2_LUPLU